MLVTCLDSLVPIRVLVCKLHWTEICTVYLPSHLLLNIVNFGYYLPSMGTFVLLLTLCHYRWYKLYVISHLSIAMYVFSTVLCVLDTVSFEQDVL